MKEKISWILLKCKMSAVSNTLFKELKDKPQTGEGICRTPNC